MGFLDKIGFSKLQKLKIISCDEPKRGIKKEELTVMFNPESIRRNYTNKFINAPITSSSGEGVTFSHNKASTVTMKLVFDGTQVDQFGLIIGINALRNDFKSVSERVADFLAHAVGSKGKIHQPPFLILRWGKTLNFPCRVTSLTINYTMFDKGGNPLRAELDVSFIEEDSALVQAALAAFESPDLTHYRMVKQGDQLPLMCNDIYGSAAYYPLVARANKLTDFRNLIPGQEIYFPPIEK